MDRSDGDHRVTIGHADGLVTLDLAEADPVTREESRLSLGEPYRTPLGHVRHEVGHWHWQAFVIPDEERLGRFRDLFGDESFDYADALERHYANGDDGFWEQSFVSFYASAHPWEDYAESFAHVLHLLGTEETAHFAGLAAPPGDFDGRYEQWVNVTVELNELARSMGTADPYPFAPSAGRSRSSAWCTTCCRAPRARRAIPSARAQVSGDVPPPVEQVGLGGPGGGAEVVDDTRRGAGVALGDGVGDGGPRALDDELLEQLVADDRSHPGEVPRLLTLAQRSGRARVTDLLEDERVVGRRAVERHLHAGPLPPGRRSSSVSPTTMNDGTMTSSVAGSRPAASAPAARFGSTVSAR